MKSQNKNIVTALGTGTSTGIPLLGCDCSVCHSLDHRDQRLRCSVYIETAKGKRILVDTTPDLRTQLLSNKINLVDFVILTHDHADHLHGIDDLRPLTFLPYKKSIPVFTHDPVKENLERRFDYIFAPGAQDKVYLGGGIPRLTLHKVDLNTKVLIQDETFTFFTYPHGHGQTMGFVHEKLAYLVDCTEVPPEVSAFLKSQELDLLIIDCLQRHTHATHLTVEQSFQAIKDIAPKKAGLIHMGHDLSHSHLSTLAQREFPSNQSISVFPLYDHQKLSYDNA
jgi:phosphoribosyl 1,2-cyclic phosphate phosphodiesterase